MLIALAIIGGVLCLMFGLLTALIFIKVITPDIRLTQALAEIKKLDTEMETLYDQVLKWNKKADTRAAREDTSPGNGGAYKDKDAYRRAVLNRFMGGA